MADRFLVLVPHEQMHAPRSILEQARKLGSDLTEMGAIKHTMELIAHSLCIANGAPAKVAGLATQASIMNSNGARSMLDTAEWCKTMGTIKEGASGGTCSTNPSVASKPAVTQRACGRSVADALVAGAGSSTAAVADAPR